MDVGLAGGLIEGTPLRLAAEIARVVNEEDKLHVIPIVTRGATENVNSLLYLRGVDAAVINTDALEEYKAQVPFIERRIVYISASFRPNYTFSSVLRSGRSKTSGVKRSTSTRKARRPPILAH